MPIEVVLFDVGGVLLFPNGDQLASALRDQLGIDLPGERLSAGWVHAVAELDGIGLPPQARPRDRLNLEGWLAAAGVPGHQLAAATAAVSALLADPVRLWSWPGPGARACLETLMAAGLRLGCVSNASGTVAEELSVAGFAEFFEVVVDSALVGVEKPDERIFRLATTAMAVPAAACLYVGDTVRFDVTGAINAGMTACHLDSLGLYPDEPADCFRIRSLAVLPGLVSSLC